MKCVSSADLVHDEMRLVGLVELFELFEAPARRRRHYEPRAAAERHGDGVLVFLLLAGPFVGRRRVRRGRDLCILLALRFFLRLDAPLSFLAQPVLLLVDRPLLRAVVRLADEPVALARLGVLFLVLLELLLALAPLLDAQLPLRFVVVGLVVVVGRLLRWFVVAGAGAGAAARVVLLHLRQLFIRHLRILERLAAVVLRLLVLLLLVLVVLVLRRLL